MTSAIGSLLRRDREISEKMMKKDAEIEKFRAEGVKRETAERKEMDELRTEMRAKDVRIQALEKAVRVHAQQDTGSGQGRVAEETKSRATTSSRTRRSIEHSRGTIQGGATNERITMERRKTPSWLAHSSQQSSELLKHRSWILRKS
jgi:hypothetical protein